MDKKILRVILILIIFIIILSCPIFAMTASQLEPIYSPNSNSFVKIGGAILGWIRNIAAVSLVVLLAFSGLRFMFGSLEQRAEYKKSLMPLCIGTLIVLGATTITSVVWNVETSLCTHDFAGAKCGSNGVCTKCGVSISSKHSYIPKSEIADGILRTWDECEFCGHRINIKEEDRFNYEK